MSSVPLPKVLTQRGKNSLEIERDNFERSQSAGIQKAINKDETPVKEKHVRTAIIGTYKERGCGMYWHVVTRLPLQGHPIVCWKFCHVFHKLTRDGHPMVIPESQKYTSMITDLGKLWGHLKEGYGRLIAFYTKLLVQKLAFHKKNVDIPGNLLLEEGHLEVLCANDVNQYFELSVDMLDYMDDILAMQAAVFGSLDMSRSNSMTSSGQCRLAPLILCILDSCQLYDYIVQILFKLHASLDPDTLGGHRDRFYKQYKSLKIFYHSCSNLQYYKNLIKVPSLPDEPPNFLVASNISRHVKPVAVVPDPEPLDAETPDDASSVVTDLLVDTSSNASDEQQQRIAEDFGQNGAPSPPMPDDRDRLISQLMMEINNLKTELARVQSEMGQVLTERAEDQMVIESLQNRLRELEMELEELRQINESMTHENEALREALKEGEKNTDVLAKFAIIERAARANEERFRKKKKVPTATLR